jgi:uncharacterized protein YjbJ (UPF0337 family)
MNKDIFQGNFKILKGKLKEKWGKLTDEEITRVEGKKEQLFGLLQSKYGITKEKAQQELSDLLGRFENDQFSQHWNEISSKIQEKFNTLSKEDIARIKGRRDEFLKLLQDKYHVNRDQAIERLQGFIETLRLPEQPRQGGQPQHQKQTTALHGHKK